MSGEQIDDGGLAFGTRTVQSTHPVNGDPTSFKTYTETTGGMTLRDYFAAKALTGLLSNSEAGYTGSEPLLSALWGHSAAAMQFDVADMSYRLADAMLKARKS